VSIGGQRDAAACGGCFQPPIPPTETQTATDITDERMLLTVSPQQTTLYDQITYSGNPTTFAWVLPIRGNVTVGLSADVLFDSVDALTATQIISPVRNCPPAPSCSGGNGGGCSDSSEGAGFASEAPEAEADAGAVQVTKAQNVGPYATVQLSSTSSTALDQWLTTNGYDIPAAVQPVLAAYVAEGFDFLAMKLLPNTGVSSMRPVRVTSTGASLTLPLRMAAIGTGTTVGITIWVVADGRYQPQNFPFFRINDSQLVWDWSSQSSNYTALRQQEEASYDGKGWELESSLSLAQSTVTSAIVSGGVVGAGSAAGPSDASQDYLPVTDASGNVTETADEVRDADVAALFAGISGANATFTRMRSDIAHAAMTVDFVVEASPDQSQLTNIRNPTQEINLTCPVYGNDCTIIGNAPATATPSSSPSTGGGSTFACATSKGSREAPMSLSAILAIVGLALLRPRRRK